MWIRVWKATVAVGREAAYDRYATLVSAPMFRRQAGLRGVLFARDGLHAVVVSLWSSRSAGEALSEDAVYRATAQRLSSTGLISESTGVEFFEVHGFASADAQTERLLRLLSGAPRS